jgi:hypothetical protein
MKIAIKSAIIALVFVGTTQAASISQNATVTADTNGQTFTFTQFDTSLGSLTAVDLIIQSSVPGGNFTLTRANSGSGNATFNGFTEFLTIDDDYGSIFDGSSNPINIAVTGNSSVVKPSTNKYLVVSAQSLLSSSPYTASIASGAWSFYQGNGLVTLTAGLTAEAQYTANKNITPNYESLFATTFTTLRYTYSTPPDPSPVPEPSQVAVSLLLLGGIGGYVFIKRRRKQATD